MNLSVPMIWEEGFHPETSGAATITYNTEGTKVTFTAADGEFALLYFPMVGFPGDTFKISVQARKTSGTNGNLRAEMPNGTERDIVNIDSEVFKTYEIEATIPLVGDGALTVSEMAMRIGVSTSGAGVVEAINPRVELVKGIGSQRCVASGVLLIEESDAVSWDTTFANFGFQDPSFSSGDITVRPSLDIDTRRGTHQIYHTASPNITTMTDNFGNAFGPVFFSARSVSDSTGLFLISGYQMTTGNLVTTYATRGDRRVLVQLFMQ